MKYPKNLEYVKAIQKAGANLNNLAHLSPVLNNLGEPYHMSGDSSNGISEKYLEKELLVHSQGKEEKYLVELMEWVDEEAMGAFLQLMKNFLQWLQMKS